MTKSGFEEKGFLFAYRWSCLESILVVLAWQQAGEAWQRERKPASHNSVPIQETNKESGNRGEL